MPGEREGDVREANGNADDKQARGRQQVQEREREGGWGGAERETERQRDRETERQRDRETERQREYVCVRCTRERVFVSVFGRKCSAIPARALTVSVSRPHCLRGANEYAKILFA